MEPKRCMTVGRDGARTATFWVGILRFSRPLWVSKIYEARPRADGILTWRLVDTVGESVSGNAPSQRSLREAEERAEAMEIPFIEGIRYGALVKISEEASAP